MRTLLELRDLDLVAALSYLDGDKSVYNPGKQLVGGEVHVTIPDRWGATGQGYEVDMRPSGDTLPWKARVAFMPGVPLTGGPAPRRWWQVQIPAGKTGGGEWLVVPLWDHPDAWPYGMELAEKVLGGSILQLGLAISLATGEVLLAKGRYTLYLDNGTLNPEISLQLDPISDIRREESLRFYLTPAARVRVVPWLRETPKNTFENKETNVYFTLPAEGISRLQRHKETYSSLQGGLGIEFVKGSGEKLSQVHDFPTTVERVILTGDRGCEIYIETNTRVLDPEEISETSEPEPAEAP